MSFYDPVAYAANEAVSAAKLNRDLYGNMTWIASRYPQRATLYLDEVTIVAGNALAYTIDTSHSKMTYVNQSASAQNDQWTIPVRLGPGVYAVKLTGEQHANGGMFSMDIDGASVGDGFDTYSAATVRSVDLLGGAGFIELVRGGVYTVTVTVYDKHASSGGYDLRMTTLEFMPKATDL